MIYIHQYHDYLYYSLLLNYYFSITLSSNPLLPLLPLLLPLLPLLHYYFHYSKINSPVWIHLIFTMTGCDGSTPPDSEDDASPSMLQLGGQDQTLNNNEMGILPLRRAAAAAAPNSGELEAGWRHRPGKAGTRRPWNRNSCVWKVDQRLTVREGLVRFRSAPASWLLLPCAPAAPTFLCRNNGLPLALRPLQALPIIIMIEEAVLAAATLLLCMSLRNNYCILIPACYSCITVLLLHHCYISISITTSLLHHYCNIITTSLIHYNY